MKTAMYSCETKKMQNTKTADNNRYRAHQEECYELAQTNKSLQITGDVLYTKMKIMKTVPFVEGYVNVFPNIKHEQRTDGLGFSSLSPKSICNIEHHQPLLSRCPTLELYYMANKVFSFDVNEEGHLTDEFYNRQFQLYNHLRTGTPLSTQEVLFHIWYDSNGEIHRLTPFETQQLHCVMYERAIRNHSDFICLQEMIQNGYNLQICGYEDFEMEKGLPVSHEVVLYMMLALPEEEWTWKKNCVYNF